MYRFKLFAILGIAFISTACGGGSSSGTAPPTIVGPTLGDFLLTREVNTSFSATQGSAPYTYTANGSVPGLVLSSSGVLSGIPTQEGSFDISVTVSDAKGRTDTINLTIVVPPSLRRQLR